MAIIQPKYWAYIDKHDGKEFQKLRVHNGKSWGYAMTYLQLRKQRKRARKEGWAFKSETIPTYKVVAKPAPNYPNKTHITPNFTWKEAQSKDGAKMPDDVRKNVIKVARELERLREALGKPVRVLSWYRSPARNDAVGGARNSQHLSGRAVDLDMKGLTQDEVVSAAEKIPAFRNGGIGAYPSGAVHLDNRGYRARWTTFFRRRR